MPSEAFSEKRVPNEEHRVRPTSYDRLPAVALVVALLAVSACDGDGEATAAGTRSDRDVASGSVPTGGGVGPHPGAVGAHDAGLGSPPLQSNPSNSGNGAMTGDAASCARAELVIERTIPTVWLLIDGSGSMGSNLLDLGAPSRWSLLREALLDPNDGLVMRLQGAVSFGLMIYDGGASLPGIFIPGICPRLITVEPALENHTVLNAAYPVDALGASTPTHYALEELSARIAQRGANLSGPTYVVLATDGMPNLCDFHDGIPSSTATEQQALATVRALSARGTKLFAISLANGDALLRAHLQQVAEAGGTGQPAFDPADKDALARVLSDIIGGTVSCEATIQGSIVKGRECAGDVRLNGSPLACNAPDGFRLKPDGKTIELLGETCNRLQRDPNAHLEASFECDDVVLL